MPVRTITAAGEIDDLFRSGRRAGTDLLVVLATKTPERRGPEGRVVFVAGKKLGGAVTRNRCKRVLREAVRRAGGPWAGHDVAVMARRSAATASPQALDAALASAIRRAKVTT